MPAPAWYPNWRGETVVLVGSGPSAIDVDLTLGIGRAKFVAINRSIDICPWADVYYATDFQWWQAYPEALKFSGLKVSTDHRFHGPEYRDWGVNFLYCDRTDDRICLDDPNRVGWGGNSGFNCLNWAAHLKPAKIILVGYDMTKSWGSHWHKPHPAPLSNPTNYSIQRWRRVTDLAAEPLRNAGITVINCSAISKLSAYAKMTFVDALAYRLGDPLPPPPRAPRLATTEVTSPLPDAEAKILDPLDGMTTMLELGNKKNTVGTYKAYFQAIGFEHVSVDLNGQDGALQKDLEKPLELGRRFDVVTNFGTSEHVDNQDGCWRNIVEHCGQIIVSTTPLPGDWKWHGRWYPKPQWYKTFAELNGFELERCYIEGTAPRRMIYARLRREPKERPFRLPDPALTMYRNNGPKVGRYGG